MSNTSDVPNVVVTISDNIVNVKLIIEFVVKSYTKISSFGGRVEGISEYIKRELILNFVLLLSISNKNKLRKYEVIYFRLVPI